MRIGIFEVNLPGGAQAPAADVVGCLRYLENNPLVGREPVHVVQHSGRLGVNVSPKDLKKILSVIERREKYSTWDRFCKKVFNAGIGARAEKYLGEILGGDVKKLLHKIDDGRFNCLLAGIVNDGNRDLLINLIEHVANPAGHHFNFDDLNVALAGDRALVHDFVCNGEITGKAKALAYLKSQPNFLTGELGFDALSVAAQGGQAQELSVIGLERLVGNPDRARALAALNRLTNLYLTEPARAALLRLLPRIEELARGAQSQEEGELLPCKALYYLACDQRFPQDAANAEAALGSLAAQRSNASNQAGRVLTAARAMRDAESRKRAQAARPIPGRELLPSGLTRCEEQDLLQRELQRPKFAGSQIAFDRLLRPLEAGDIMQPFAPRPGEMNSDEAWEACRQKFARMIGRLPDNLFENPAAKVEMVRALTSEVDDIDYHRRSWFLKTMHVQEVARSPGGKKDIRDKVATAINFLERLQQDGRHGDVYRICKDLASFADACPDRATFGVNLIDLQARLLARQGPEADPDKRALLMAEELVHQAKLNAVRLLLMGRGEGVEAIEGYLLQCLRFKDILGLPVTMSQMLYAFCGQGYVRNPFGTDLHTVLTTLSQVDNLIGFLGSPPEDSQLSGVPRWDLVSNAPLRQMSFANEGALSRLRGELITPMLQALGYVKCPPLPMLCDLAHDGSPQAITILYWIAVNGDENARRFLVAPEFPISATASTAVLGLLAKLGNVAARDRLVAKVEELTVTLTDLDPDSLEEAVIERRQQVVDDIAEIGRYGIDEAVGALEQAGEAGSLWELAKMGPGPAFAAMQRLYGAQGDAGQTARMVVNRARQDGDPVAFDIAAGAGR